MVKLVNTADLKSADREVLPVRFRLGAPIIRQYSFGRSLMLTALPKAVEFASRY